MRAGAYAKPVTSAQACRHQLRERLLQFRDGLFGKTRQLRLLEAGSATEEPYAVSAALAPRGWTTEDAEERDSRDLATDDHEAHRQWH